MSLPTLSFSVRPCAPRWATSSLTFAAALAIRPPFTHRHGMHILPATVSASASACDCRALWTIAPCSLVRGLIRIGFCAYCSKIKCLGGSPCGNCQRSGHAISRTCEYAPVPVETNRAVRHKKAVSKASKRSPLTITTMAPNPSPPISYTPYLVFTLPPDLPGMYDYGAALVGQPVHSTHVGQLPPAPPPPTGSWPGMPCAPWAMATPPPTSPVQSPTMWGSPQWPWPWDPPSMPAGSQIPEQHSGLGLGLFWYHQGEVFPDTVVTPTMGHTGSGPWTQAS
jgi:hypothetical protein